MNKKIILFLISAATILLANPRFFTENRDHDWGTVEMGDRILRHTFQVVNQGTDTLRINSIRPSCGCAVAKFDSIIAPGRTGRIVGEFNMRGRTGMQRNSLTVISNDPEEPQIRLTMATFITAPLDIVQRWMSLHSDRGRVRGTVSFLTQQTNFVINSAQYTANTDRADAIVVSTTQTSRSGPDENGNFRYDFDFHFVRNVDRFENGTLTFNTNVSARPTVSSNISIEPLRDAVY
ncbi:MAG: DUF1573 domain-containing protein [Chitinivibrionia bacterium]|nr:DUF1573 domain-containing protein [Chitinivibrionia bacterium]